MAASSAPPTATRARVQPASRRQAGLINWTIVRVIGEATGTGYPGVFATLAHNRRLFRRWLRFAGTLMPGGTLPRADCELLILRVSANCGCKYEADHHRRIGATAGLSREAITAALREGGEDVLDARQGTLLAAADELHDACTISDALWARLEGLLAPEQLIELCMLIGHYEMLAMTLNATGVAVDRFDVPASGLVGRALRSAARKRMG